MFKNFFRKDIVLCVALGANVNNADEWLKYADKEMRGDQSHAELVMTIQTPNWTRELEIESDSEGKSLALSTIKSPAKEKGIRTLRIDNNMWNYLPKLKRKISISSSMLLASWMGSDFTNDDILKSSSMSQDYHHKFKPDEKIGAETFRVIDNTAKSDSKVMWPSIVSYSSKKDCLPRLYRYYDKQGVLRRTLTLDDVKTFDGHKVPTKWEMKPEADKSKKTTLTYKDIKFKTTFGPNHFSQKNLTD
ncbi:MAG TPA: outer membrane lipoprotein-sorting protein [Bacteriovoracaceae bacterium]|nr:outer membrane lipoprotein-sorting protein [Bacteriovoracaceae bacterium]